MLRNELSVGKYFHYLHEVEKFRVRTNGVIRVRDWDDYEKCYHENGKLFCRDTVNLRTTKIMSFRKSAL